MSQERIYASSNCSDYDYIQIVQQTSPQDEKSLEQSVEEKVKAEGHYHSK